MNSPSFDLVIFDCDGVLVNSEPLANQVIVQILYEYGFAVNESAYLIKYSGVTLPDRMEAIERDLNWKLPDNFLETFNQRLIVLSEKELKTVDGIHELVSSLSVPICIASNGSRDEINMRLQLSKLKPAFGDSIFSGLEVPNPKPSPDVYLAAAKSFGIHPSRCVVIEDSIPGVTAGVRAGMRVYGYAAFTPEDKLRSAGAIPFVSMYELKERLALEYSQVL